MITDRDIRERVEAAVRANGAELAGGIDVDGVTREIVETYGLVDIETIEPEAFWALVERHDATREDPK